MRQGIFSAIWNISLPSLGVTLALLAGCSVTTPLTKEGAQSYISSLLDGINAQEGQIKQLESNGFKCSPGTSLKPGDKNATECSKSRQYGLYPARCFMRVVLNKPAEDSSANRIDVFPEMCASL